MIRPGARFAVVPVFFVVAHVIAAQNDAAHPRAHTGIIDGVVSDSSLAPIGQATVSMLGTPIRVVTGNNGRFRMLGIPEGDHVLIVRRIGYEGVTTKVFVEPEDASRIAFALLPVARRLPGVEVYSRPAFSPRMQEFYERKERAEGGIFITREDIVNRNPVSAYDMLQAIPSIKAPSIPPHGGAGLSGVFSTRSNCELMMMLDGLPIKTDQIPPPESIGGIEIYPGPATIPLQYKTLSGGLGQGPSGAGCGLILLWSGDGK